MNDNDFWDRLGLDDGLMPVHLPVGVNSAGRGPENDSDAHHYVCWCADAKCPLSQALALADAAARADERERYDRHEDECDISRGRIRPETGMADCNCLRGYVLCLLVG